ncbi:MULTISPECIES: hypothetical protein [Amycolatopsis]|uniref:Uncharacterized protein n=1 Tax=Amycolatopsis echigonensis TaxID=2576905 RepID=A0A8E1VUD5_9PSEU|nr:MULTISPECIES: hypothetical protein [Amycolatopsis]MBB2498473.1 hypothetical protein [Amycolatopsis echigonensis]
MTRHVWVLLAWSSEYGAATTPVGVLGLDLLDAAEVFVEWVPRIYEPATLWRQRIAGTSADEIAINMGIWENSPVAPAARVESLSDGGLAEAVQRQVDDLLASG